jgi:hypothetical protein
LLFAGAAVGFAFATMFWGIIYGKTIMPANDERTEFGDDPFARFLASRFFFMASESLNRWTPVASAEENSN